MHRGPGPVPRVVPGREETELPEKRPVQSCCRARNDEAIENFSKFVLRLLKYVNCLNHTCSSDKTHPAYGL